MNPTIKTYGVVINLDYAHRPFNECKTLWLKIVQNMLHEDFHIDKRMFVITTFQGKDKICEKARRALSALDNSIEIYNRQSFHYITDFFVINMSDYVDLRLPTVDMGVTIQEQCKVNVYLTL